MFSIGLKSKTSYRQDLQSHPESFEGNRLLSSFLLLLVLDLNRKILSIAAIFFRFVKETSEIRTIK